MSNRWGGKLDIYLSVVEYFTLSILTIFHTPLPPTVLYIEINRNPWVRPIPGKYPNPFRILPHPSHTRLLYGKMWLVTLIVLHVSPFSYVVNLTVLEFINSIPNYILTNGKWKSKSFGLEEPPPPFVALACKRQRKIIYRYTYRYTDLIQLYSYISWLTLYIVYLM